MKPRRPQGGRGEKEEGRVLIGSIIQRFLFLLEVNVFGVVCVGGCRWSFCVVVCVGQICAFQACVSGTIKTLHKFTTRIVSSR